MAEDAMLKRDSCPLPELVQAYQMETLPSGVQQRVGTHVLSCESCQALLEVLDDPEIAEPTPEERRRLHARVRAGVADEPSIAATHDVRTWFIAAAAVLVGCVATALMWQFTLSPRQPVSLPRLEKPARPARDGLVWRGSAAAEAQALAPALEPFDADDFLESSRTLGAFVSGYPRNADGRFYLGVSRLFVGADADAVVALEEAERLGRDDADLAGHIAWYLALAYARVNQVERASGKLDGLCRTQHVRAAQACTTLRELDARRR
jgi:cytochrome c-type biogenesis protein CcmH/NrfG